MDGPGVRRQKSDAADAEARSALLKLADQFDALTVEMHGLEGRLVAWHRQDRASKRLATVPSVGIITATALTATIVDPSAFLGILGSVRD